MQAEKEKEMEMERQSKEAARSGDGQREGSAEVIPKR
jgi:hypothetical protein